MTVVRGFAGTSAFAAASRSLKLGPGLEARDVADIAAAFQRATAEVIADRTTHAIAMIRARGVDPRALVVAGGVAANARIRATLARVGADHGLALKAPPAALCTDNAAMIAWAGLERLDRGGDPLDMPARPRWPLDPRAA